MNPDAPLRIPPRLAVRPRWRGLPVPYIATLKPDGEPDFRVTDVLARDKVILERRCQLCGEFLGKFIFFVGGPACASALAYYEPPCHLGCLMYAMQVCPFIAGGMEHASIAEVQAENPHIKVMADQSFTTVKSEFWVIIKATHYNLLLQSDNTVLLRPENVRGKTEPLHAQTMSAADWRGVQAKLLNA
jgi:hypothetical protein